MYRIVKENPKNKHTMEKYLNVLISALFLIYSFILTLVTDPIKMFYIAFIYFILVIILVLWYNKISKPKETELKNRCFLLVTTGRNSNNELIFSTSSFERFAFPTHKECIDEASDRFPNVKSHSFMSISEISVEDKDIFISEQ